MKKNSIFILSIIAIIISFILVWYFYYNEAYIIYIFIIGYAQTLFIASLFYYTIKHIINKEYKYFINIGLLVLSIFILISPYFYPIAKIKAEIEFNKYENKINKIKEESKKDNYKDCNKGICIIEIPMERKENYVIYRNDIEVQFIEFPLISRTFSLVYSNNEKLIKEFMPVDKINIYKENWYFVTKKD